MDQNRPGGEMRGAAAQGPTRSQLLPFGAKWQELPSKPYFFPGVVMVIAVLALFHFAGQPDAGLVVHRPLSVSIRGTVVRTLVPVTVPWYTIVLALLITSGLAYALHRILGKKTVWWLMPVVAVAAAVLTESPVMGMLQSLTSFAGPFNPRESYSFVGGFIKMFFLAGVPEESLKAIPVALGVWAAVKVSRRDSMLWPLRVTEPLDGIQIGIASGLGFALVETLLQYVPDEILRHNSGAGLELMIPRLAGNICGHAAYAGVFGYYIGLAAMKPAQRVKLVLIGLAVAASMHAAWNGAAVSNSEILMLLAAVGAFALLITAILKAREISPVRSQLLPSQVIDTLTARPAAPAAAPMATPPGGWTAPPHGAVPHGWPSAGAASAGPAPAAAHTTPPVPHATPAAAHTTPPTPYATPPAAPARSMTWDDTPAPWVMEIGSARMPVRVGACLYERQAPGTTASRGDGIVAEVNTNPNDHSVLGLKNLSNQIWHVTTEAGDQRELAPGRSIRISRGMRVALGDLVAEVK